jgi:hypothetical protein
MIMDLLGGSRKVGMIERRLRQVQPGADDQ